MEVRVTRTTEGRWEVYYNGKLVTEQRCLWKAFSKAMAYFKSQNI